MECRGCFEPLEKEKLCKLCTEWLTVEQKIALCENEHLFRLLRIEENRENKRIALYDAIPSKTLSLNFDIMCDDMFTTLLPILALIPKDLIRIIDSYSCNFFSIRVDYDSQRYVSDTQFFWFSYNTHTFWFSDERHSISLRFEKNLHGKQVHVYWNPCVLEGNDCNQRKKTNNQMDWDRGINLETFILDCPHHPFLKSLSHLFRCLQSKFWEFRV